MFELQEPPRWTRMKFVRCVECGAKALVACSQCPQCGHPLGLRDSRGVALPLAYCGACDLYYPRTDNDPQCRWCGSRPQAFRKGHIVGAATIVAVGVVMTWAIWDANTTRVEDPSARVAKGAMPESTIIIPPETDSTKFPSVKARLAQAQFDRLRDSIAHETAVAAADSARAETAAISAVPNSATPTGTSSDAQSAAVTPNPATTAAPPPAPAASHDRAMDLPKHAPVPVASAPRVTASPTVAHRASSPSAVAASIPSASVRRVDKPGSASSRGVKVRWVAATVRGWVTVRSKADKSGRAIASLGPDTRVQLGDWRGTWVHVRSRGISGWVDGSHPLSIAIASTSGARGLTR